MTVEIHGESLPRSDLTQADIREMVHLMQGYYEGCTPELFAKDLSNKHWVILLRDPLTDAIKGFSTLAFYESRMAGMPLGVVYSGDTIIHPDYWGTTALPRMWIETVLRCGETLPKPLYWLLISAGYKTYRFLTVFFRDYYPRYNRPTPPETQAILHHLALERFGTDYCPELGVVRFAEGATPLRAGVADITEERLKNPHVAFFVARNPGHAQGDELVCLTQVHAANLTAAGRRMLRPGS